MKNIQFVVAVSTAAFLICFLIFYFGSQPVPFLKIGEKVGAVAFIALICVVLREIQFFKPKDRNLTEIGYILVIFYASLFSVGFVWYHSIECGYMLLGGAFFFSLFHPRYGVAITLTAIGIAFLFGPHSLLDFFKGFGIGVVVSSLALIFKPWNSLSTSQKQQKTTMRLVK